MLALGGQDTSGNFLEEQERRARSGQHRANSHTLRRASAKSQQEAGPAGACLRGGSTDDLSALGTQKCAIRSLDEILHLFFYSQTLRGVSARSQQEAWTRESLFLRGGVTDDHSSQRNPEVSDSILSKTIFYPFFCLQFLSSQC